MKTRTLQIWWGLHACTRLCAYLLGWVHHAWGDGYPLLNEMVLAKYYNKLVKLNKGQVFVKDARCWDGFKSYGYIPLAKVERND